MSEPDPRGNRECAECGAWVTRSAPRCWLCGGPLDPAGKVPPGGIVVAQVVPERRRRPAFSFGLSSVLLVMTLVAVALGVARVAPGLAMLLGIVSVPAVVATSVRATRSRQEGMEMTTGDKVATFLLSTATVLGIFGLLIVAALGALFALCVAAMSGTI